MRALGMLAIVALLAPTVACPPDWDSLEYPPTEGEGEGEGEGGTCEGGLVQADLVGFDTGAGNIIGMVEENVATAIAVNSEGDMWRIDLASQSASPLEACPTTRGLGQLMRSTSGVVIRTGTGSLCTRADGGAITEVALGPAPPDDVPVGGAILQDAAPIVVLVAYAVSAAGAELAFDRIEVSAEGIISAPTRITTRTVSSPEARLWRVGNGDRVAVSALSGELFEAQPSGGDVTITDLGRMPDVEGFGFLAFGTSSEGATPVVAAVNGSDPEIKIRTGIWEQGLAAWGPMSRGNAFLAGHDQSQGVLFAPDGRVVHFGDFGYLAVQPSSTEPATPVAFGFRVKDVLRVARGPDDSLWAVTADGGVARWNGSAAFCEDSLGTPSFLADVASSASGPIVPLSGSQALVGLDYGVVRVDAVGGDATERGNDQETREIFIDDAVTEALLVRVDGRAQRLNLDTMTLVPTATPLGVDATSNIELAATRDQTASSGATQVLWVAGRVDSERALVRCTWQTGSEPSCEAPLTVPAGPLDLGADLERFGAVRVLGDDIVVLMASGAVLGRFAAPGAHEGLDLAWVMGTNLRPLNDNPEHFATTRIAADVVEVRPGCALLTGFGPQVLALDTTMPSLTEAHVLPIDPFQTAVTRLRGDTFLGSGGLGASFYRFTVDPSYCALVGEVEVLGPARPKLQMLAGVTVGDSVWVAEENRLWQVPTP